MYLDDQPSSMGHTYYHAVHVEIPVSIAMRDIDLFISSRIMLSSFNFEYPKDYIILRIPAGTGASS